MEYMIEKFMTKWPKAGMKEVQVIGDLPPLSVLEICSDKLALPQSWSYSVPCNRREISVWFYRPSLKVCELELKRCEDGHLELTSGWRDVVHKENFKVGEVVTLWSFKDGKNRLWLAMHYKVKEFIEGSMNY